MKINEDYVDIKDLDESELAEVDAIKKKNDESDVPMTGLFDEESD